MDEIMQEEKSEVKKESKGRGKDPRKAPRSSTPYIWIRNEKLAKKKKRGLRKLSSVVRKCGPKEARREVHREKGTSQLSQMLVRTEKNKDRETSVEFGSMEFTGKCGKSSLGGTVAYGWAGG